jgi:hypothetical protein
MFHFQNIGNYWNFNFRKVHEIYIAFPRLQDATDCKTRP